MFVIVESYMRYTPKSLHGSSRPGTPALGPAGSARDERRAQPETFTSYQKPPFRSMLLPLAWPGPLSPM
jgi:hypothetical protein